MKGIRSRLVLAMLVASIGSTTYGAILHSQRSESTITKGAVLIKEQFLMTEGWRNINILKVDLNEPNVELRPIESSTGTERQTILQMVEANGAIAGVNADYFDLSTTDTPSFGPVIHDGNLKHGYNSNYSSLGPNKFMGTFLIDTSNTPSMAYYGISVKIKVGDSLIGPAATYNNIPSTLTRPVILDRTYQKDTTSVVNKLPNTYTIVIEDHVVVARTKSGEAVTIPENGYVILLPWTKANEYYSKLPLGTEVELEQSIYLQDSIIKAINEVKLGIGGGGLIMKDGEAYTGSAHKVTPNSQDPRTIVATVKGSNEVLLITIDGRNKYTGMKHSELVEFLKRYNIKDAMYLDGGGSTTLVSRNEAESKVEVQNKPSNGSQRKVVNGIGIFTTSELGALNKLYLEADYDRTFVGESVSLKVKGTDANSNPIDLTNVPVQFSVEGIDGNFNGNTFIPNATGKALVKATYNGISATTEIKVSAAPKGIKVEPAYLQIDEGSSKSVQIYGLDSDGYAIPLNMENIVWENPTTAVSALKGNITGNNKTVTTLTANYKGQSTKLGVTVGKSAVAVESFESNTGTFTGNSSSVVGKVEVSKEIKYHGNQALKMAYTFNPSNSKQVAYTKFNTPIIIPEDSMAINFWVNARGQGHTAKIEVVDQTGKVYYLKLTDSLNFTGWKYLSTELPAELKLPAKVTKFYTYANTVNEKIETALYLDHMSITRGVPNKEGTIVDADYRLDPMYKESLQDAVGNQSIINIVGQTQIPSLLLSKKDIESISNQLSRSANVVLFASRKNTELPISVSKEVYSNTFKSINQDNAKVIMLGTESGGLRVTEESGWTKMKAVLEETVAQHIILVMSKNPLTQFTDTLEGTALHEYLAEYKKATGRSIVVVYTESKKNTVTIEDGIRYIGTNGLNVVTDDYKACSFVKFKIDGNQLYYTFERFK